MEGIKNELKLPNDNSIASFLLSLYSKLNSGNNNSGQREEELVRGEYDLSASHPLMALMHKSLKPYKSRYTTALLSFLNCARVRMRNVTIDTLVVLFVLRPVGELAENIQVNFLYGKAISMLL